ncbi:hypothetical protein Bca52824_068430 [Brassica carinata]|uniref:Uncharacterized protein n=1 Tax=Brassica carinata TaxID=52824 RepID=A0A8X7U338_BRACI|nr:hypothetical protein Bca52824_068430 [Brassica carinata]
MDKRGGICSGGSGSSGETEVRKGPWTMEEDLILINYIANHGDGVWNTLAKSAGLKRTGKSCRLRWLNYLRPDVRRGNITPEEQLIIMELHAKWGNRQVLIYINDYIQIHIHYVWSKIAKHLPGRTDNEIKNFWRTRIQKYIKQTDVATTATSSVGSQSSEINDQVASTSGHNVFCAQDHAMETYSPTTTSYQHSNMEFNYGNYSAPVAPVTTAATTADYPVPMTVDDQTGENYWGMDDIWSSMHLLNGN